MPPYGSSQRACLSMIRKHTPRCARSCATRMPRFGEQPSRWPAEIRTWKTCAYHCSTTPIPPCVKPPRGRWPVVNAPRPDYARSLHKDLKPVQIAASYALATMPEEHPALIDFLLTAPDLLDNATAALFMEDERALPLFRQRVKDCETARRALAAAGDASLLMELHQTLQSKNNWEAARGLTSPGMREGLSRLGAFVSGSPRLTASNGRARVTTQ